ncbi:hypothetical protein B0T19DRAFT_218754 [Cercophora scortea]|uniref:Secreted protein n=1 Tax=Cercophora scortea TaxID=314031 RepID=A0AAE0M9Y5_9PEZI|nr:hypothetical protein B0T19DRAFT_218754 [Cercophora scortea]
MLSRRFLALLRLEWLACTPVNYLFVKIKAQSDHRPAPLPIYRHSLVPAWSCLTSDNTFLACPRCYYYLTSYCLASPLRVGWCD